MIFAESGRAAGPVPAQNSCFSPSNPFSKPVTANMREKDGWRKKARPIFRKVKNKPGSFSAIISRRLHREGVFQVAPGEPCDPVHCQREKWNNDGASRPSGFEPGIITPKKAIQSQAALLE